MVAVAGSPDDPRNLSATGSGQDGVVRVSGNGIHGSGALLWDGRHILTAAHLARQATAAALTVEFTLPSGTITRHVVSSSVHPDYVPAQTDNDLALLQLDAPAPLEADRYAIYRDTNELGQVFTLAGYGDGVAGTNGSKSATAGRRAGENRFDTTMDAIDHLTNLGWHPTPGKQLAADFDSGTTQYDTLGTILGVPNTGQGLAEALTVGGDSGGPALIDGKIAGVASYAFTLSKQGLPMDTDGIANGTFGEIAAWTRVSAFAQWVDQTLRADWAQAPRTPAEVLKSIPEGNSGTTIAWFLLTLSGVASVPCSVAYRTIDGGAIAGQDYVAAAGRVVLWPGETAVAIPVEVIGDGIAEADENFYLEVYDPSGGSFPNGAISLMAMRTVLDNDTAIVRLTGVSSPAMP